MFFVRLVHKTPHILSEIHPTQHVYVSHFHFYHMKPLTFPLVTATFDSHEEEDVCLELTSRSSSAGDTTVTMSPFSGSM